MAKRINMKGPLVDNNAQAAYDYYGMDAFSGKALANALPSDGDDIVLVVNSNGGLVTAGSEIYTALRAYPGHVTAEIVGMAASAASVAVMGADRVVISPTAQMMVHKALFSYVSGNSDDLDKASQALKSSDKAIVNAYVAKTGLDEETVMALMKSETFMSAQEAVERGFADEMMDFETLQAHNTLDGGLLPQAVIDDYYHRLEASESKRQRSQEIAAMLRDIEKEEILNSL